MPRYYSLICLVPAILYVSLSYVLYSYSPQNLPIPDNIEHPYSIIFESGSRIYLLALSVIFFLVSIACIIKVIVDIYYYNSPQGILVLAISVTILLVSGFGMLMLGDLEYRPSNIDLIGKEWFKLSIKAGQDPKWNFADFDLLIDYYSIFATLAIASLVVGGIACLDDGEKSGGIEHWRFQAERFKVNIFMSSGLLVIGVLLQKAWLQYPLLLLNEPMQKTVKLAYTQATNSLIVYNGLMYSLLAVGYALPVAFFLSRKAKTIAADLVSKGGASLVSIPSSDRAMIIMEERKKSGLVLTAMEVFQTFIALIAPLLTGALSGMFSALG